MYMSLVSCLWCHRVVVSPTLSIKDEGVLVKGSIDGCPKSLAVLGCRLAPDTTKNIERFDEEDRSRTHNEARRIQGIHVARYRGSEQQRSSSKRIATESYDNTMSIWRLEDDDVKRLLGSGDVREVGVGIIATLEFYQKADVLPNIIATLLPTLVTIADGMLNTFPSQPASQEIPVILHLILKTYKTAIIVNLFPHQQSPESLIPWGRPLFRVVGWLSPWKVFQLTRKIGRNVNGGRQRSGRMESSHGIFGNPSQLPSQMQTEYGVFAEHFVTAFASKIFKFTFNASKQAMWEADLVEYIRASVDEYENFSSSVSGATSFLLSLASNRTKTSFLSMLQFINTVLRSYLPVTSTTPIN
ncbi:hypothetical protein BD769DRAFT_1640542 [Suillus cothurnatus]|nr:hypothetical protein BD769DRAFT_1640542 [Suillus cothurnatus]